MYISELLLLRALLNGRLDSLIQSQCNISEASQHLDVRVIFYYSLLTAFCGRGRAITHLYKYSSLPLCQTACRLLSCCLHCCLTPLWRKIKLIKTTWLRAPQFISDFLNGIQAPVSYLTVSEHGGVVALEAALDELVHAVLVDVGLLWVNVEHKVIGEGLVLSQEDLRLSGCDQRAHMAAFYLLFGHLRANPERRQQKGKEINR